MGKCSNRGICLKGILVGSNFNTFQSTLLQTLRSIKSHDLEFKSQYSYISIETICEGFRFIKKWPKLSIGWISGMTNHVVQSFFNLSAFEWAKIDSLRLIKFFLDFIPHQQSTNTTPIPYQCHTNINITPMPPQY